MQSDANPVEHAQKPAQEHAPLRTDVLIVGAGPVGLFAAFEAGVVGLSCQIVDALGRVGGQCVELYPDKPIYDIPAIPSCTARELVERLMQQCRPFDVPIHLDQRVMDVVQRDDGRWTVRTEQGMVFDAAAIMLAAGNGAFLPQRLMLPEAAALEERDVLYSVPRSRIRRQGRGRRGRRRLGARLGARAAQGRAAPDARSSAQRVQRDGVVGGEHETCSGRGRDGFRGRHDRRVEGTGGTLQSIAIKQVEGVSERAADKLVVLYGLVADLGPIAGWGLDIRGGRIEVDTSNYESSRPGIFAVGDIANYPNKQKLILSGFHEASLALRKAYSYAYPEKKRVHVHSSYDTKLAERVQASATAAN